MELDFLVSDARRQVLAVYRFVDSQPQQPASRPSAPAYSKRDQRPSVDRRDRCLWSSPAPQNRILNCALSYRFGGGGAGRGVPGVGRGAGDIRTGAGRVPTCSSNRVGLGLAETWWRDTYRPDLLSSPMFAPSTARDPKRHFPKLTRLKYGVSRQLERVLNLGEFPTPPPPCPRPPRRTASRCNRSPAS
jgi:hypothetical protein